MKGNFITQKGNSYHLKVHNSGNIIENEETKNSQSKKRILAEFKASLSKESEKISPPDLKAKLVNGSEKPIIKSREEISNMQK